MTTRRLRLLSPILVVACCLFATGCSDGDGDTPAAAPDELTGVILNIDAHALGEVTSFELKVGDEIYVIYTEPEHDYGFPLGHLTEHLQTSEPVRVSLKSEDGKLYALEIEDA